MILLFTEVVWFVNRDKMSSNRHKQCNAMERKKLTTIQSREMQFNFVTTDKRIPRFHQATYMMGDCEIERKEKIRDVGLLVDHHMTLIAHLE